MSENQSIAAQRRWSKVSKKKRKQIGSDLGKKSVAARSPRQMKRHIAIMVEARLSKTK